MRLKPTFGFLIALSAFANAGTYNNSISFLTGSDELDFKYTRRFGAFEVGVNPGLFSVLKSWMFYNYTRTVYYSPALYFSYRLPITEEIAIRPEFKIGYDYWKWKCKYQSPEAESGPGIPPWLPPPTPAAESVLDAHETFSALVQSIRVNFEMKFNRIVLGFYPGLIEYSLTRTNHSPDIIISSPSRGPDLHVEYGIYSGLDF